MSISISCFPYAPNKYVFWNEMSFSFHKNETKFVSKNHFHQPVNYL